MMTTIAQWTIILAGVWLIAVAALMAASPRRALYYLAMAASTDFINYTEITLRLVAGAALVVYADHTRAPEIFRIAGWFIAATSAMLYVVPRRWHARYAVWWSRKLGPILVRSMAPFSMAAGGLLIYAVL